MQCPVGLYEEDLSTGENTCVPCPTNSFSTMEGSRECTCFNGHFRTELEEPNSPCTCETYSCYSKGLILVCIPNRMSKEVYILCSLLYSGVL